jgi:hypothetical protein
MALGFKSARSVAWQSFLETNTDTGFRMMSELDHLIRFASDARAETRGIPPLPHEAVVGFMARNSLSASQFLDAFARRVAHEYWDGILDFDTADAAMNSLHAYTTHQYDVRLPGYAWEVFLAFDQGEFHHREDDASVCPEEKYTKPEIRSIVARDQILGARPRQQAPPAPLRADES